MIRLASLFILFSLVLSYPLLVRPVAQTALPFTFLGMPALALGVLVYGYSVWRSKRAGRPTGAGRA